MNREGDGSFVTKFDTHSAFSDQCDLHHVRQLPQVLPHRGGLLVAGKDDDDDNDNDDNDNEGEDPATSESPGEGP